MNISLERFKLMKGTMCPIKTWKLWEAITIEKHQADVIAAPIDWLQLKRRYVNFQSIRIAMNYKGAKSIE